MLPVGLVKRGAWALSYLPMGPPILRDARDSDSEAVIALVARVMAEFPGCVLDVDAEEPELRRPASSFEGFWVVEAATSIVGCGALKREGRETGGGRFSLCKLYLDRDWRGHGLGRALIERIESCASERGASELELWSDTRFEVAHGVYQRMGFRQTGERRELHDLSNSSEWHFVKTLGS